MTAPTCRVQPGPRRRRCARAAAVAAGAWLAAAAAQAGLTDRDWMAPVPRAPQVEAPELLSGIDGGEPDTGGQAALSALLDRLRLGVPTSAGPAARIAGVAGVDPDCALFADSLRVRRLLDAAESQRSGNAPGPASATRLDMPFRCLDLLPRVAPPPPVLRTLAALPDPGPGDSARPRRSWIEATEGVGTRWWTPLAGIAGLLGLTTVAFQAWRRWSGW